MKTLLFAAVAVAGLSLISAQDSPHPSQFVNPKANLLVDQLAVLEAGSFDAAIFTDVLTKIDGTLAANPAAKSPSFEYLTVVWPVPTLSLDANGQPQTDNFYPLAAYGDWEMVSAVSSTTTGPVNVNAGAVAGGLRVSTPVIVYTLRRAKP